VVELRLKEGVVAAPAVHEHQWGISLSRVFVMQAHAVPRCVWHGIPRKAATRLLPES
jgi:hypothetical protein